MFSIIRRNMTDRVSKDFAKQFRGFCMSSNKTFTIQKTEIRNINIMDKTLANKFATHKVLAQYNKLLAVLTELIVSDDETGESFREALNQIEKFRLIIKNKYREFLKSKELEMMAKQLSLLKKEANQRLLEIQDSLQKETTIGRGK